MDHKNGKWATEILNSRNDEGLWGDFHSLSRPVPGKAITTEQALRRLRILGFTKDDAPVQTVLDRMRLCVSSKKKIDNYSEKTHDWALFEKLMLSAWIRLFDPDDEIAVRVAGQWAAVAERAFSSGQYNKTDDEEAFYSQFGRKPKSGFESGFGMYYHVVLLRGILMPETESRLLDYYLTKPDGIYYVYDKLLERLPEVFASKQTSYYLAAVETLSDYRLAREKLDFVAEWLEANRTGEGQWDLGAGVKDGVYFPLSDSWRKQSERRADCTERITGLLQKITR